MKLSVIIPVYNEKNTILKIIEKVQNVPIEKEIIIVDDGSTDGTRDILNQKSNIKNQISNLKVILKERNEGKGSAIRRGLEEITWDVVVIQDADLEYEPMDFLKLIKPIEEGKTKVVYGSRVLSRSKKSSLMFYMGGRILSFITNFLYNTRITDEPTCYKMFKAEVIKSINLKCRKFEFCPEITAKVRKKGYKIIEIPINYNPRSIKQGKKIRWKDGLIAVWTLVKYKFVD